LNRSKNFALWIGTLLLIGLCLSAGKWQLNKGLALTHKNQKISAQVNAAPLSNPVKVDGNRDQWIKLDLNGRFLPTYRLIKNQYQDGQFGFHVLQDFYSNSLGKIGIDRGWVRAGATAETPPVVPAVNPKEDQILVRVRSEFLNTHVGGSLFAMPTPKSVSKEIYYDQLDGRFNKPITSIDLPDLSTGPHYAYAFQWVLFALVLLVGRVLIERRVRQ
jgi:cytochrome oxidase assembly protein ShyY1